MYKLSIRDIKYIHDIGYMLGKLQDESLSEEELIAVITSEYENNIRTNRK